TPAPSDPPPASTEPDPPHPQSARASDPRPHRSGLPVPAPGELPECRRKEWRHRNQIGESAVTLPQRPAPVWSTASGNHPRDFAAPDTRANNDRPGASTRPVAVSGAGPEERRRLVYPRTRAFRLVLNPRIES